MSAKLGSQQLVAFHFEVHSADKLGCVQQCVSAHAFSAKPTAQQRLCLADLQYAVNTHVILRFPSV